MSEPRTCRRCSNHEAGFDGRVPFRSPLREEVLADICQECWSEWLQMQVKIINEFALNLGDPRSHDIIEAHARDFFGLGDGGTGTDFETLGSEPPSGSEPTAH